MPYKAIASLIPTIQAASLAGHNLKVATKKDKTATDFLKLGATNVVGVSIIKAEAGIIGGLW